MNSKYAYQCIPEEFLLGTATTLIEHDEDLGEQIRKQLKNLTNPAGLTNEASDKLKLQIDALERLTNNTYAKKNQRTLTSTATGLSAEQCNQVLSSDFMQYLSDEKGDRENKKKIN